MVQRFPNYTPIKLAERGGKDGLMTYLSVHEYMEENKMVEQLSFHRSKYFFQIYVSFLSFVLLIKLVLLFFKKETILSKEATTNSTNEIET